MEKAFQIIIKETSKVMNELYEEEILKDKMEARKNTKTIKYIAPKEKSGCCWFKLIFVKFWIS